MDESYIMGLDSSFFLVTAEAIERWKEEDVSYGYFEKHECSEETSFVTRNNHVIPYYAKVRCDLPPIEDSTEKHVFDLMEKAKTSDNIKDMAEALSFYTDILMVAAQHNNKYVYAIIWND